MTAAAPRVTAAEASGRQPRAAGGPVKLNRFDGVVRTSGFEAATEAERAEKGSEGGRDDALIGPQPNAKKELSRVHWPGARRESAGGDVGNDGAGVVDEGFSRSNPLRCSAVK